LNFDGEQITIRYGPGEEFDSSMDFFSPCPKAWRDPYEAMLQHLAATGWLEGLPADEQGVLRVAMPFCGSNQELPVLAEFLAQRFLPAPGGGAGGAYNGVHILGSDIVNWDIKGGCWRQKEKWVSRRFPGVQVQYRQLDMGREQHPDAALVLGIHPECTAPGSPWPQILENCLRSTRGVCLIACFKEGEMEVVRDVFHRAGASCEVHENPYWQEHPIPPGTQPAFVHYLVLSRGIGAQ